MELLLIGMSRFARRRVLPAAAGLPGIKAVNVASAHADAESLRQVPKLARTYDDWRRALRTEEPGLVYVSMVNSAHEAAVRYALDQGHHVVVDKPAFSVPAVARELVGLARSRGLVIAEATCYAFHPVFARIASLLRAHGTDITKVSAAFTPPVPPEDFRYERGKGGGALLDTGPYMASLGRVLWGTEPERLHVIVGERTEEGLDTSYGVLAGYPGGKTIAGQFGFTTGYRNSLVLAGRGITIEVERPFSAPPDLVVDIRVDSGGERATHSVPPADSMLLFLSRVIDAVRSGSREFDAALLSDARTLDRLRSSES
jgi:NDP-hexose-3-ketoreductase